MEECFRCEISETRTLLFEVISSEGILKICRKCFPKEDLPTIKHKVVNLEKVERSIKQRIFSETPKSINFRINQEDSKLKDIVDQNFQRTFKDNLFLKESLIENFHWIVMRARRMKHLTPKEFGEAIKEPEIAIKLLEQGKIPENNSGIINKLENYLGIHIRKDKSNRNAEINEKISKIDDQALDIFSLQDLTLSELKELKIRKEQGLLD